MRKYVSLYACMYSANSGFIIYERITARSVLHGYKRILCLSHTFPYIYLYACMHVCALARVCVCVFVCVCTCLYMCACVSVFMYVCVRLSACMHAFLSQTLWLLLLVCLLISLSHSLSLSIYLSLFLSHFKCFDFSWCTSGLVESSFWW